MFAYAVTIVAVSIFGVGFLIYTFFELLCSQWMKKLIPPLWGRLIVVAIYVVMVVTTLCSVH